MPQGPGLPVWEAIERWAPNGIWQRYREIAKADIQLLFPASPHPLQMEAIRLRGEIERILTAKLRGGELIASGLAVPLRATTRRRDISPELWLRLQLSIQQQEASGDGLTFVELRFREPEPASREQSPATLRERQPSERRSAGQPSLMKEIAAEMRRRAASGELAESLAAEAEALAAWAAAQEHLVGRHVPMPKSIQRQLAGVYREVRDEKKPR